MPYIKQEEREELNEHIETLFRAIHKFNSKSGIINYAISVLLWKYFERMRSYARLNEIVGVLECIKLEFYRRIAGPYEDDKKGLNGDLDVNHPKESQA